MLILSWITIFISAPNVLAILPQVPAAALKAIIIGGILFGVGQICFALAFKLIGIRNKGVRSTLLTK